MWCSVNNTVQTNGCIKKDNALPFPACKTQRNSRVFTFWMKWLCYSCVSLFTTAKWFLNTWPVLWKIHDAVLVCYAKNISKPSYAPLSFAACIRLPPTSISRGDIRGGELETVTSNSPFSEMSGAPIESFALSFFLFFSSNRLNFMYLFIYLQTANNGRPKLEIIIGNAKANKIVRRTHTKHYK